MIVEASAGTGKTTLLTDRVASLVLNEGIPLESLVVVTFTEAAAAELRVRIRHALEGSDVSMGSAWISTIHGFASRILREYPHLTRGVSDFTRETSHFSRRELRMLWDHHLAGLPEEDAMECLPALNLPGGSEHLRELTGKIESNRWITDTEPFGDAEEQIRSGREELRGRLSSLIGRCADPSDGHRIKLAALLEQVVRGDPSQGLNKPDCRSGSQGNWGGRDGLKEAREETGAINGLVSRLQDLEAYIPMEAGVRKIVLPCALRARRLWDGNPNRMSFDDLLYHALQAVIRTPELGRALASRFRHILIDEFQDTSLLQARLFLGILESSGLQGRLTIVGDPKQSIYGWRNADIETYTETIEAVARAGALVETISTSFRSSRSVIRFVNAFGEALFSHVPREEEPFLSRYSPLLPAPDAPEGTPPLVLELPSPPGGGPAAAYQARVQAEAVADILSPLKDQEYGEWAVLFRSSTRLEELIESLDHRGIPYIVEAGRDFKKRLEVTDTAMLLRTLTDPGNLRARVHTLRSLYFGFDDATVTAALQGRPSREVQEAEVMLERLRASAANLSPGLLVETVFRTTCITEAVTQSRYEVNRRLANLRRILEKAGECRDMGELQDFLEGSSTVSSEEPSASPEEGRAVTLSTVHRAKGLTWSNVILLHPGKTRGGAGERFLADQRKGIAGARLGEGKSPHFPGLEHREKARTAAEFRRLLYVAVTRPRDRLVIFTDSDEDSRGLPAVLNRSLRAAEPFCRRKLLPPLDLDCLHPRRGKPVHRPGPAGVIPPSGPAELQRGERAMRLGSEVHALLEKIDLENPGEWLERSMPLLAGQMEFPERAAELALAFFETPLPFPLEKAEVVGREYPLLSRGKAMYVDLLLDLGSHLEIIDFKTDSPESLEDLLDQYRARQYEYADVLEEVTGRPCGCRLLLLQSRECVTLREPPGSGSPGGNHLQS